ncbi:hypothetical protein AKO1_006924 [Acrasis kona]|uniref:Protein kinase domain-containing protein n=1 Tax=Acrasis kona TaxID=1008807 RepID=A0AAW2YUL6_9EUKA
MKFATIILEKLQQQVPQWSNFQSFQTDIKRYLQYMQQHYKSDDVEASQLEDRCEPWQIEYSTLKLGKKIAEGYFGEVYKGTYLQKKVAIKRLKFTQINDSAEQDKIIYKLKEEAGVMSSLRHPNILLFMGIVPRFPNICIVTEFAENGNLYDVLQNKVVDDRMFFRMIKDICYGMNYLHNKNILHLDLKPLNLLVDDNLNVKVSDFGISRIMIPNEEEDLGPTGYGTILYMAPELIYEPITYSFAADVFGFGVLVFELMYLREHPDTNFTIQDSIGYDLVREPVSKFKEPVMPPWWMETFNGLICECTLNDHTKRPTFEKILKILDVIVDDSDWFMIRHHANSIRRLAKNPSNHQRLLEANVWDTLNKMVEIYSDLTATYYAICAIIGLSVQTEENPAEYLILALDHLERLTCSDIYNSSSPTSDLSQTTGASNQDFLECLSKVGRFKYIDILLNSDHVVAKGKERVLRLMIRWMKHEACAKKMIAQGCTGSITKMANSQTHPLTQHYQLHYPASMLLAEIAACVPNDQLKTDFVDQGGIETLVSLALNGRDPDSQYSALQALVDVSVRDSAIVHRIRDSGIEPVDMASRAYLGALLKSDMNSHIVAPGSSSSNNNAPKITINGSSIMSSHPSRHRYHHHQPTTAKYRSRRFSTRTEDLQPFMSLAFQKARSKLEGKVMLNGPAAVTTGQPLFFHHNDKNVRDEDVVARLWEILRQESDLSNVDTQKVGDMMRQWFSEHLEHKKEAIESQIQKVVGQMEQPSMICESYLYLGSEWNSANLNELRKLKITHICNVGVECPDYYPESFSYMHVKLSNTDDVDLVNQFDVFFAFIEEAILNKHVVLVHSRLGVGRSASYCIAWVMFKYKWSLQKAYKYVKDKRRIVKPSQECMRQLIRYDVKLFGRQSLGIHAHYNGDSELSSPPQITRTDSNSSLTYDDVSYGSPNSECSNNILSPEILNKMKN